MARLPQIGLVALTTCLGMVCICSTALCQAQVAEGTATTNPRAESEGESQGESQGIWYTVGTIQGYARHRPDKDYPAERYARVYPGKDTVYSGPMATYCAWHRPMAIYATSEDKTYFVFGNPRNYPTISYYDHRRGAFAARTGSPGPETRIPAASTPHNSSIPIVSSRVRIDRGVDRGSLSRNMAILLKNVFRVGRNARAGHPIRRFA